MTVRHRRRKMRPHDHLVLLCQLCHGDLNPSFSAGRGVAVWECADCHEWFVYTRWGWARIDGAAAAPPRIRRGAAVAHA